MARRTQIGGGCVRGVWGRLTTKYTKYTKKRAGGWGWLFFWGPGGGHVDKTVRAALMERDCHWWWGIGVLKQSAGAVPKHGHVDIQSLQH